ncbi:MAG: glycosyltransferase family 2 protein [Leptospirillum sp.]
MTRIAVLIPCLNEALTIGKVIDDFHKSLPGCSVYVCDNGSTDQSAEISRLQGATVLHEHRKGKGFVVSRMFRDIDASIYILVDGDDTYDPEIAGSMVKLVSEGYDLVNAVRVAEKTHEVYRPGHEIGNVLTDTVHFLFGDGVIDMLSGYKALSRRFVKSFPVFSEGVEIETEIVVHALELGVSIINIKAPYRSRPPGSRSKRHSFSDGQRILMQILTLLKQEKPLHLFSLVALYLTFMSLVAGTPVIQDYSQTGLVPRLPTALLSTGMMILAFLSFFAGLIIDTVSRGRKEAKMLAFLSIPSLDHSEFPSLDPLAGKILES